VGVTITPVRLALHAGPLEHEGKSREAGRRPDAGQTAALKSAVQILSALGEGDRIEVTGLAVRNGRLILDADGGAAGLDDRTDGVRDGHRRTGTDRAIMELDRSLAGRVVRIGLDEPRLERTDRGGLRANAIDRGERIIRTRRIEAV